MEVGQAMRETHKKHRPTEELLELIPTHIFKGECSPKDVHEVGDGLCKIVFDKTRSSTFLIQFFPEIRLCLTNWEYGSYILYKEDPEQNILLKMGLDDIPMTKSLAPDKLDMDSNFVLDMGRSIWIDFGWMTLQFMIRRT